VRGLVWLEYKVQSQCVLVGGWLSCHLQRTGIGLVGVQGPISVRACQRTAQLSPAASGDWFGLSVFWELGVGLSGDGLIVTCSTRGLVWFEYALGIVVGWHTVRMISWSGCFCSVLLVRFTMLAGRFSCKPLVLDVSKREEDAAGGEIEGMGDKVASGLGGMTIVSAHDDACWLGVEGRLAHLPQSAPARGHAPPCSSFSGSILVAFLVLMDPPSLCTFLPVGRTGGGS
jgi:hypothetical protein